MANLDLKPQIISVKELLQKENLTIPNYQRPYKWTTKNVNQLVDDILFHNEKSAYRLGTLVIHQEKNERDEIILNIVDGQQRALTLTLIAYAITQNCQDILEKIYKRDEALNNYTPKLIQISFNNDISKSNIQNNYKEIERRVKDFDETTIRFFFDKCELVQVILSDVSEAFQFFDSQNSRGKDLEPHDLLKAFHLREMDSFSTEEEKRNTIKNWESMDTEQLSKLFALYLFRIRNWSKGYSARYFTKNDINIFKGVSPNINEELPFAKIFRIAHYYTDSYNNSYHRNIEQNIFDYPFQLDQTVINGKRFFEMIDFYDSNVVSIKNNEKLKINDNALIILKTINDYEGRYRTGDKYIRNLFYCALIYYVDKFGEKNLSKAIEKIFIWAYTLRLKLQSVGLDSIDNYALNKAHSEVDLFKIIKEAITPNEIINIKMSVVKVNNSSKTKEIEELFKEMKYYDEQK